MRIEHLKIANFKGFELLEVDFDPQFNILVGPNGTGKSTLLEALRIAVGSLFLEVDKVEGRISSPGIGSDFVRIHNLEPQYPVEITACAQISSDLLHYTPLIGSSITWSRTLERHGGRTTKINAKEMSLVSEKLQEKIRETGELKAVNIPLIAYYSTDRFKKEKKDFGVTAWGSRLRGYYNSLDPLTNIKFFLELFKTETLSGLQHNIKSSQLEVVKKAIQYCIDDCKEVYWDVAYDKLLIEQKSTNEKMPFEYLSDGVRSVLAMVMEIAFRCYLLNPHLSTDAAKKTTGIVLIDEIDLHLHPQWQKKIVNDLKNVFPNIQFIVTTHAPLVIGSLRDGAIYDIAVGELNRFPMQYGRDANAILADMGTQPMAEDIQQRLNEYFLLIEKGEGKSEPALELRFYLVEKLGEKHAEIQRANMMLSFF